MNFLMHDITRAFENIAKMSSRKPSPTNKPSTLLSREENEVVFKLLGPRCQTLSTTVVQVFGTEGPHHNTWRKRHCGAITFTKDNVRRSYYIQVYDVVAGSRVFEQELYTQFTYTVSKPFFHQFEAEEQMIGLNFADEREASFFSQAVNERLVAKQRKKEERKRQAEQQQRTQQHVQPEQPRLPQPTPMNPGIPAYVPSKDKKKNNKKGNKNKSRLSKEQIGMPTDFKHITHVGFDPDKGLTQFNVDDKLEGFFKMVGVSEQQLSDHRTREFIYDFIEKNGGVEKAMQETQRYSSQPPPPLPTASINSTLSHHQPPPPPPVSAVPP
ncbi:actin nucleation-promoting factor WAS-like, partial [Macrobrachium nipponense]|uniref:actin nucleation-promoting factor WAS-like n=1 Tax=Macrobrachium nipponense TaxID=159736 RepID=UPI0030C7A3E4